MDVATQLDAVVAIDAEDLLDDVAGARDVHTVAGYTQRPELVLALGDLDLEAGEDTGYVRLGDLLPDEAVHVLQV